MSAPPLVVDLDGTLTRSDTLVESLASLLRSAPGLAWRLPLWLLRGRAAFKAQVAAQARLNAASIPLRDDVLHYLREQKAAGRQLVLATAAHRSIAVAIAARVGVFDQVLATDGAVNLKGEHKLAAIRDRVGPDFVYAGDSAADRPIWRAAKAAILVGASPGTARQVRRSTTVEQEFPRSAAGVGVWLRALRAHHWLKNCLLVVPLLTTFLYDQADKLLAVALAFVAFSLVTSGTYLLNDIWDLEADRAHPRKRHRAIASGHIRITCAAAVAVVLLAVGLTTAWLVSTSFAAILLGYIAVTTGYSWWLKEQVLIDVIVLSLLYTVRIVAGSVAIGVATSFWLLAFSVFLFLSLALIKRCSELVMLAQDGHAAVAGRGYRIGDLTVLWPLGTGSALAAVVVFGLFISTPQTQGTYATPDLLWLTAMALIYWLSLLWIKAQRGEIHDDPVVFAIRDRGSRLALMVMVMTTLLAHSVEIDIGPALRP